MSTALPAPGPAEHFAATLRGMASQAAENRPAGIVVSLILALLTNLFLRLADLMERIKAGEYQPQAPRQAQGNPRLPQHRKLPGKSGRQYAAMPEADKAGEQPGTPPLDREMSATVQIVPAPTRTESHPDRRPSRLAPPKPASPAIARSHRRKAHHKPAPWHAHFVTL